MFTYWLLALYAYGVEANSRVSYLRAGLHASLKQQPPVGAPTKAPAALQGSVKSLNLMMNKTKVSGGCSDGSPKYKTCAYYKKRTLCEKGKTGTVRRRAWGGDAKDNCAKSCGYCTGIKAPPPPPPPPAGTTTNTTNKQPQAPPTPPPPPQANLADIVAKMDTNKDGNITSTELARARALAPAPAPFVGVPGSPAGSPGAAPIPAGLPPHLLVPPPLPKIPEPPPPPPAPPLEPGPPPQPPREGQLVSAPPSEESLALSMASSPLESNIPPPANGGFQWRGMESDGRVPGVAGTAPVFEATVNVTEPKTTDALKAEIQRLELENAELKNSQAPRKPTPPPASMLPPEVLRPFPAPPPLKTPLMSPAPVAWRADRDGALPDVKKPQFSSVPMTDSSVLDARA